MKGSRRQVPLALIALILSGLMIATGCGKGKEDEKKGEDNGGDGSPRFAEVSGMVKFDGKPLITGLISFQGKDASENTVAFIEEGKYTARGVPVGDKIKVTIDVTALEALRTQLQEQMVEATTRAGLLKQAGKSDEDARKRIDDLKDKLTRSHKLSKMFPAVSQTHKIAEGSQTLDITLP